MSEVEVRAAARVTMPFRLSRGQFAIGTLAAAGSFNRMADPASAARLGVALGQGWTA